MRRVQWFELEDLPWLPAAIRDGGTDALDTLFARIGFYDAVMPAVLARLREIAPRRVVDLGSGGGGGALQVYRAARRAGNELEFVLTDRFPNASGAARVDAVGDPRLRYERTPVDAHTAPIDPSALYTICSALHHFPPDMVQALFARLVAHRVPLAVVDVAASPMLRRLPAVLLPIAMGLNMLVLFLVTLLLMPLVRPFHGSRLALTYLLPAIPVLMAWDGTVSAMRAYTPDELLRLATAVPGADRYEWSAGRGGSALYLIGHPQAVGGGPPLATHALALNGVQLPYVDEGLGRLGTMLMIHGEQAGLAVFRQLIPQLTAAGYRVVAPDLSEAGLRAKPAAGSADALDARVTLVRGLIDRLDLRSITLVAHADGVAPGLVSATNVPDRFVRLLLLSPGALAQPDDRNDARQDRVTAALARWPKPAHLLVGDSDPRESVEASRQLAARIPGATLDVLPVAGRSLPEAGPALVDLILRRIAGEP